MKLGGGLGDNDSSRNPSASPSAPRGATTSGGENERDDGEQGWKPPDQELIRKLVDQIEFYFSDENLEKDAFLLKHVRRNKLGYVSVKLLTSFKKVRLRSRRWTRCQGCWAAVLNTSYSLDPC